MKMQENKFISWIKDPSSDVFLFIIAVVLLNLVSVRAFVRLDMTKAKSYSLSGASREVAKTLEEPLNVKVFFSNNLPAPYSTVNQYVRDILIEYKNTSNGNFSYEFYDMTSEKSQSLAGKFGISPVQIREVGNSEVGYKTAYMGMVMTYADQIEKLDGLTSSSGLEYKITTTIGKILSNTNILAGLAGDDVTVTLYLSHNLDSIGIDGLDKIERTVHNIFDDVNSRYQNKMILEIKNPSSAEVDEITDRYGIQGISWKTKSGGKENAALGIVVEAGSKFRVVPLGIQNVIFGYAVTGLESLEDNLVETLRSLASKSTRIAYISNHGEKDLTDPEQGAGNLESLFDSRYSFENVDLSVSDIPAGVQCVMINGARTSFSDEELYKLDQFLMHGGNLMIFADPFEMLQNPYTGQTAFNNVDTRLDTILSKYGVKAERAYVMDENCFYQNTQQYGRLNYYYVPLMSDNSLNQKCAVTQNLGNLIFFVPGPVDVSDAEKNKDIRVTKLASTSPRSWIQSDNISLSPFTMNPPSDKSMMKPYDVAVLLEGKFTSAFDKAFLPGADSSESVSGKDIQSLSSDSYVSKSIQSGKILLVSTSEITGPQVLQANSQEPVADFLRNAVDYMNGNESLCIMRTKGLDWNTLHITSSAFVGFAKYFNIFGIVVLAAAAGFIVLVLRNSHRKEIRMIYDADDVREVSK